MEDQSDDENHSDSPMILLKKNLSQAKTQVIHKLTRKAKTLTETKAPDHLKEKLKKKAESAVREVLIIKKITRKELGRFIVTHEGQLQQYLNKPMLDQNRACARLLLHKALQQKYKSIRSRFSDVPIKDLFMSRQERLKLKKEAREEKKKKKEKKGGKVVNAQGDWDVEDVVIADNEIDGKKISQDDDERMSSDEFASDASEGDENSDEDEVSNIDGSEDNEKPDLDQDQDTEDKVKEEDKTVCSDDDNEERLKPVQVAKKQIKRKVSKVENVLEKKSVGKDIEMKFKVIEEEIKKKQNKKPKDANKNKNLNEKLLSRKFKKDSDEITMKETKVVDPFFITSSGENYMSVAEPRQPDEVKEIHKQGNRQMRRAAMFGHVPKIKPRQNFYGNNDRFNQNNNYGNRSDNKYEKYNGFQRERFNENKGNGFKNNGFDRQDIDGGQKRNFKDRNTHSKSMQKEEIPEKLHPSWEAKKKQSGILPFEGKKIVFSED